MDTSQPVIDITNLHRRYGKLDTVNGLSLRVRELGEEIGLKVETPPPRLFKIAACAETEQEFVWVYRLQSEGPFVLHPEEIERGEWFTPARVTELTLRQPGDFASGFVLIWRKLAGLNA